MTKRSFAAQRTPRVLMVVRLFHPWVGGTEVYAQKLSRSLAESGVNVKIVTGWWFRGTPRSQMIDGVSVFRNQTLWEFFGIRGLRKFGGYLYMLSLAWFLWARRDEYDVVHVHGLNYHAAVVAVVARRLGKPVVVKLANSGRASDISKMRTGEQLALSRFMLRATLSCDRFVAVNATVVEELVAVGVDPHRIVLLPNAVDVGDVVARSTYEIHDPARLLFVGRLHPQKGLDLLLDAMALVVERHPAVTLTLVGEGPQQQALAERAHSLGLDHRVEFAGRLDDVTGPLSEADVFVLPSRAEGLSNALLEAMASGLPAVVSDVPGNSDVIEDGVNGILVAGSDVTALADAIGSLLGDQALRARLGSAARTTVSRSYDLREAARQHMRLYDSLLETVRV